MCPLCNYIRVSVCLRVIKGPHAKCIVNAYYF